ncbi:hypothetical protein [Sphingomonas sp. ERG5]|uniref:hypothetical protein n=1 Tax=Sphingomonas sp. ERG5 TaxID=1381597 RepID=UPI00054BA651|nr:hypothetical protein [Sphingomonas sp. ERG5]
MTETQTEFNIPGGGPVTFGASGSTAIAIGAPITCITVAARRAHGAAGDNASPGGDGGNGSIIIRFN